MATHTTDSSGAPSPPPLAGLLAWVVAGASALLGLAAILIASPGPRPWDTGLYPLALGVPGALIASHLPRNPVGWLLLAVGSGFALNSVGTQYLETGDAAGAAWWAWWVGRGGGALLVPATLLLVVLLPSGRLPSRRWRPSVAGLVCLQLAFLVTASLTRGPAALDETVRGADGLLTPLGALPSAWNPLIDVAVGPVLVAPFLIGVPVALTRLRRATPEERSRIAMVVGGVLLFVLLVTLPDLAWPDAAGSFHVAGAAILSGTVLVAVLRGDFEQVEVVVSRALLYGVFTVLVTGVYVALVALTSIAGLRGPLAGVGTAVVALALLPARRLAQTTMRRLVYGVVPSDRTEPPGATPSRPGAPQGSPLLSRRENEVMALVARGMTNNEVAAELFISPVTVRNHVSSILTKLGATNRTHAVVRFQAAVHRDDLESDQSSSQ